MAFAVASKPFKGLKLLQLLGAVIFFATLSDAQCVTSYPYLQDFEATNGNWTTGGTLSDWAWGKPAKSLINTAASGQKCWIVGGLNKSAYNDGELAWVKSPCFNLSSIPHPYISFKVFWETENKFDGAVLEYSINNGTTWLKAGSVTDPANCLNGNWFNSATVRYANNGNGWSGSVQNGGGCGAGGGSGGWVLSQHTFPFLAGQPNVQFRFLFGAGTTCNAYNGFAFDDFSIAEAPANQADFSFNCVNGNTVNFTNASSGCPTYSWNFGDPGSGSANTSTAKNPTHAFSTSGTFTVRLTASGPDNAPSTITKTVTVIDLNTQILTSPLCKGDKTGSASVSITPNIAGVNYSWNTVPAQLSNTASNLGAGTYIVTVTGTDICNNTDNITIVEPPILTTKSTIVNQPSCANDDGAINLTTTGGTAPYTYTWDAGAGTTSSATGLAAGDYNIVVKDKNGCSVLETVTLSSAASVTASIQSQKNVTCFGNKNGSIDVSISGGTGPYNLVWSPYGGNAQTAINLGPGTFTLSIKDKNGCTATASATIIEPAVLSSAISKTDASCGNANGSANAVITGGVTPYTYSWAPGSYATGNISNLAASDYYLTVTDNNGCKVSDQVKIANTGNNITVQMNKTDVTCFGKNNGTASVTPSGGVAPYTILWSNGAGSNSLNNLAAGTYSVSVKDALGCLGTGTVIIAEPTAISVSLNASNALCNGGKGDIISIVSGGTGPYQYTWTPAAGTGAAISAAAGNYSVLVTDKNGCSQGAATTILEPPPIAFNLITEDATCGLNNGKASFPTTPIGGTGPLVYQWSSTNANNATSVSQLAIGTYSVTVKDANNCQLIKTFDIKSPHEGAVSLQLNSTDAKCFGSSNGTATALASGGNAIVNGNQGYNYTWSNGSKQSNLTNLAAGTYSVTVTSISSGCSHNGTVTVNQPAAMSLSTTVVDAICNGDKGSISAQVSGGASPYQYAWTPGGSTGATLSAAAGNYSLQVTDKNGCMQTGSATIKAPAAIAFSLALEDATCGLNNGTAAFATPLPSGGTGALSYLWSPSNSTGTSINKLAVGNYSVTVKDATGCQQTKNFAISTAHQGAVSLALNSTDAKCFGTNSGTATAVASGGNLIVNGNLGYTYNWSNGATGSTVNNLAAGTYSVIVKSISSGCTHSGTVTINQSPQLAVSTTVTNPLCATDKGSISSSVNGGAGNYQYVWTPGNNTGSALNAVAAGNYQLTVTDKNNCAVSSSATVVAPAALANNMSVIQPSCSISSGTATANISGGIGPYTYLWTPGNAVSSSISNLAAGTYSLTVKDKNGCSLNDNATIVAANSIIIQSNKTDLTCFGDNNGTASVSVTGGTPVYSIAWNNGASGNAISNLSAGTYTVNVRDASNCLVTKTITINQPEQLKISLNSSAAICTSSTGKITSSISGGVPNYQYLWQPGAATTPQLNNVAGGTYNLTVTDKNGCSSKASSVVATNNPLKISIGSDTTICANSGDKIILKPGNFTGYQWQDGTTTATYTVVTSGTYTVNVKDQQGCVASASINIKPDCGEVYFPTAFTPNGDQQNDLFGPLGNLSILKDFELVVFNRWGQKVFQSTNPFIKWNGRTGGTGMVTGTYIWHARYSSRYGTNIVKSGTVVLVL